MQISVSRRESESMEPVKRIVPGDSSEGERRELGPSLEHLAAPGADAARILFSD
jgi:hypothetical protein